MQNVHSLTNSLPVDLPGAIYRQTILPFADYCCFLLESSAKKTLVDRTQVIQNQALRICLKCKMRDETVIGLHKRCEMPALIDRRKEFLSSLMFRKSKKIVRVNALRQARQAENFNFPLKRPRSDFYIKSPYYS